MTPHPSDKPDRPPRRRWRWRTVVAAVLFPVVTGVGIWAARTWYVLYSADRELAELCAELDRTDTGWRLEELEAKRDVPREEENAATTVLAAKQLLPSPWPPKATPDEILEIPPKSIFYRLHDMEPQLLLDPADVQPLRTVLKDAAPALAEARKLITRPRGRYTLSWAPDVASTPLPYQATREVANLLWYEATVRAQDGDSVGALLDCRGVLNAGRSIGDDPFPVSMLVRIGCQAVAVRAYERALALGQVPADVLEIEQKALEQEADEPLALIVARGERALKQATHEAVRSGKLHMSDWTGSGNTGPEAWLEDLVGNSLMRRQYPACLRTLSRTVEIAALPAEQRDERLTELRATIPPEDILIQLLLPALIKIFNACQRTEAVLRCAATGLAVERYRLMTGRWPERLDDLVSAKFIKELPRDPYDGKPLRLRRPDDGLFVYSVGPDGMDDDGLMNRANIVMPGTDIGFRLWDVPKRRQPPRPAEEKD